MTLWKVYCQENEFPGLWHRLYRYQCVAVGWPPPQWTLHGETKDRGWERARKALSQMAVGDYVVAALNSNRVGRLGQVTALAVKDSDWDPLVPISRQLSAGEMGRRIKVRWDLACGPTDRDIIVLLPPGSRLTGGELRNTISEIRSQTVEQLQTVMNDPANWVGLLAHFKYENALADYIASYPHHLEDGLVPHPDAKIREKVFSDRRRLDVLLLDRFEIPVIVECKQGVPTVKDLQQLRHYMSALQKEAGGQRVRGILVHGGSRNLYRDVAASAALEPIVEIVQYRLHVDFASSSVD